MIKKSAGILLFRFREKNTEFLLAHPGGPFWARKDIGVWSIPKGELIEEENPLQAAIREFFEETGLIISGDFISLSTIKQKNAKLVYAFALEHDLDVSLIKSNTFKMEWPPKSGMEKDFPEIDKAEWFDFETAKEKIIEAQLSLINELIEILENRRQRPNALRNL